MYKNITGIDHRTDDSTNRSAYNERLIRNPFESYEEPGKRTARLDPLAASSGYTNCDIVSDQSISVRKKGKGSD